MASTPRPRPVTAPDAPARAALAALQGESWRSAYRGVIPDAFLDAPADAPDGLAARLAAEWSALSLRPDDLLLVSGPAAAPDAFALVLAPADPAERPYLDHLHVRPAARGAGLGEALLRDAARRLLARGADGLWLWVFEVNAGARGFYARLGAQEELRQVNAPYGQPQPCLRLGWTGAAALAALARA